MKSEIKSGWVKAERGQEHRRSIEVHSDCVLLYFLINFIFISIVRMFVWNKETNYHDQIRFFIVSILSFPIGAHPQHNSMCGRLHLVELQKWVWIQFFLNGNLGGLALRGSPCIGSKRCVWPTRGRRNNSGSTGSTRDQKRRNEESWGVQTRNDKGYPWLSVLPS